MRGLSKYFTGSDSFTVVFILTLFLLSFPHMITFFSDNFVLIGKEPYYHYRMANEILERGAIKYDYLSYGGKPYIFNPYHYVLAGAFYIFGSPVTIRLLPLLLGLSSAILFYRVLKRFNLNTPYKFFTLLIFVSSPVFIYTFVLLNSLSVVFFLALAGFYFLLSEKRIHFALSLLFFSSTVFFGLVNSLVIMLFLLVYFMLLEKRTKGFFLNQKKKTISIFLLLFLLSFAYYFPIYLEFGLSQRIMFIQKNAFGIFISDLGGNGFAPFAILLAFVGLILTWNKKYKLWPAYLGLLVLTILAYNTESIFIYLNVIVSLFASYTLIKLLDREWELPLLKTLAIFILFLGLSFSTVSYINRVPHLAPGRDIVNSLSWLNKNSEEGTVFSHYSKGYWIEALAKKDVLMDESFSYAPNPNLRFQDSEKIFQSRNLDKTKELLTKYGIDYIWIDGEMRTGLVWTKEQQGLLFLFRNNETFKNIYNQDKIEIWQVK